MRYEEKEDEVKRLKKAMVGTVINPGQSYLIQEAFAMEGVFSILATPLGANMVLLEGGEEEEDFHGYVEEAKSWLSRWFKEIKPWSPTSVDEERLVWVRCYSIPSHVWDCDFFSFLTKDIGAFVNSDKNTMKKKTMDVARLMLRTSKKETIQVVRNVIINGVSFSIKLVEDWFGPMSWTSQTKGDTVDLEEEDDSSYDDEEGWSEGLPENYSDDDDGNGYGNNIQLSQSLIGCSISNSNGGSKCVEKGNSKMVMNENNENNEMVMCEKNGAHN